MDRFNSANLASAPIGAGQIHIGDGVGFSSIDLNGLSAGTLKIGKLSTLPIEQHAGYLI